MNDIGPANIASNNVPFRASTVVNINDQKVLVEQCFSWSKRFVLPGSGTESGTKYIAIDFSSVDADKIVVILPVAFAAHGAGPVFIDFFANPTFTGGTVWAGANRNANASNMNPQTIVKYLALADVSNQGVKQPAELMIPSDGVSAVSSFGGQTQESLVLIANKSIKYMFKLVNQENVAANCTFAMSVFEALEDI